MLVVTSHLKIPFYPILNMKTRKKRTTIIQTVNKSWIQLQQPPPKVKYQRRKQNSARKLSTDVDSEAAKKLTWRGHVCGNTSKHFTGTGISAAPCPPAGSGFMITRVSGNTSQDVPWSLWFAHGRAATSGFNPASSCMRTLARLIKRKGSVSLSILLSAQLRAVCPLFRIRLG